MEDAIGLTVNFEYHLELDLILCVVIDQEIILSDGHFSISPRVIYTVVVDVEHLKDPSPPEGCLDVVGKVDLALERSEFIGLSQVPDAVIDFSRWSSFNSHLGGVDGLHID